jgi:RHS repeat-associated protein
VQTVTGSNSEGYTYDKNGNRTNGGYVTGSGNRLMSDGTYSYEYDPEGNRTKRTKIADNTVDDYTWDYRNRLMSIVSKNAGGNVTKTVGYEYDVDDQRVKKTVDGVVENYFIDRNQIAFVTDGSGNETFHYLYGLNVDAVMAQDSSTGMLWSLADRLGSIDTLTDAEGVVVNKRTFDSFGRVLSETNPSVQFRYGYTGRERDLESGLDYYRARYYDPNVGRFISVDPLGFGAGDTNLYRYVGNNSTNYTDPSGQILPFLAAFWVGGLAVAGAGAIFGGVTGFAKSLANSYDNGEQLSLGVIGNAIGEGVKGAAVGAVYGFAIGGAIAATAVASTFLAAAAGVGMAAYGLYNSAGSAVENFQAGRYASAGVDLVSGLFDVKGVRDGVGQSVSAYKSSAKSGKWYNGPDDWGVSAWDVVKGYESQSSGLTRDAMVWGRQNTLGYYNGEMMPNGVRAGAPGSAHRDQFDTGRYQGTSTYEFLNRDGTTALNIDGTPVQHSINHLTSPIAIPESATAITQAKTGQGRGTYYQVQFTWNETITRNGQERSVEWLSRWHTKTPGAPKNENSWVVERQVKGIKGQTIRRPGQAPLKILQIDPEPNMFYLQPKAGQNPDVDNPDNWVDQGTWEAAKKIYDRTKRSSKQEEMLDRGHWNDRESRR